MDSVPLPSFFMFPALPPSVIQKQDFQVSENDCRYVDVRYRQGRNEILIIQLEDCSGFYQLHNKLKEMSE